MAIRRLEKVRSSARERTRTHEQTHTPQHKPVLFICLLFLMWDHAGAKLRHWPIFILTK